MHLLLRRVAVVAAARKVGMVRVGDVTANVAEAASVTDVPHRRLQHRRRKRIRQQRSLQLHRPLLRREVRRLLPRAFPAVQSVVVIAAGAGTVGVEKLRTGQLQRPRHNRLHRPGTANNSRRCEAVGQCKERSGVVGETRGSGLLFRGAGQLSVGPRRCVFRMKVTERPANALFRKEGRFSLCREITVQQARHGIVAERLRCHKTPLSRSGRPTIQLKPVVNGMERLM